MVEGLGLGWSGWLTMGRGDGERGVCDGIKGDLEGLGWPCEGLYTLGAFWEM